MAAKKRVKLPQVEIGILGGTGLYEIEGIEGLQKYKIKTPWGDPSDAYIIGTLAGRRVAFLSRHGRGHRLLPMDINYRANIYGFKMLGVERIISVNSCGSLKEEIRPRDIVFSDQFYDRTRRANTFFGGGIAAHIGFAHPVCPALLKFLYETSAGLGIRAHLGGTYISIEGPAFSSQAESKIYRSWGCDVIGMTAATEAKLCREAEICYSTMNLVTDYDVWHAEEESVSVGLILENLGLNIHNAKAIIKKAVATLPPYKEGACDCRDALKNTIVTNPGLIPQAVKKNLKLIIDRYIK
ncbi:MAG: S-methyl-5'-thioadenosine phosphorylase [Candidatus Aminicenantes bacterium]|jgi:5'-methylthioadenosine phosphorylase|nr:S-methyl-5'-thioadenosine phosphorylase [Candidatus Aminicenantes bacterium]